MEHPCVPQPPALRTSLFCHQLASIYQMEQLEKNSQIWLNNTMYIKTEVGILSDLAGYGKTLSILGLIARSSSETEDEVFRNVETGTPMCRRVKLVPLHTASGTLIVTNASLVAQWESELQKTSLPHRVVHNRRDVDGLTGDGIILCPSNMLHILVSAFANTLFRRIVIDEPVTLKIAGFGSVCAEFMWLVTATPYDLIGRARPKYLAEILPNDSDLVGRIIVKNPDNFVRSSFCMPATHHSYLETTDLCPKVLKGIIPDSAYAVLESGNVGRFLSHCGIKRAGSRHFLNLVEDKLRDEQDSRLDALRDRLQSVSKLECVICSDAVRTPTITSCCHQVGCASCFAAWLGLASACPLCRSNITCDNLTALETESTLAINDTSVRPRSKLSILEDVLNKILLSAERPRKVLIYAHYEQSGKQLQTFMGTDYKWADLRGTRGHKERVLQDYRDGNLSILLLTCVVDSAGFNLQNTTDVILFDKPSEYVESQVIGRALRVGRTSELKVWHIV